MAKKSNGLIGWMDDAPWLLKIIFCLPMLNIVYAVYRIVKGVTQNKPIILVAGIVWLFAGWAILWIVDLVCTILYKKPTVFA